MFPFRWTIGERKVLADMSDEYVIEGNWLTKILDQLCLTPFGVIGFALLMIVPLIPYFNQEYMLRWFIVAAIMGMGSMVFDFSSGYIAVVNFGFAAFVGLGGYTSALTVIHWGIPIWMGMVLGAVVTGILGALTGAISLRMRGMFAICLTWFIGLALMGLAFKMAWLTRGSVGLNCPYLFTSSNSSYYYWYTSLGLSFLIWFILKRTVRSHLGLAFLAIGQNMDAAMTSGVYPTRYRIINFTISCALAGLVGGFYGHFIGVLTPNFLSTAKTIEFLVICYLGGRGSLWGGFAVAFPFIYLTEMLRSTLDKLPGINLIIYGIMLILVMVFYAGGMAQLFQQIVDEFKSNPKVRWLAALGPSQT